MFVLYVVIAVVVPWRITQLYRGSEATFSRHLFESKLLRYGLVAIVVASSAALFLTPPNTGIFGGRTAGLYILYSWFAMAAYATTISALVVLFQRRDCADSVATRSVGLFSIFVSCFEVCFCTTARWRCSC